MLRVNILDVGCRQRRRVWRPSAWGKAAGFCTVEQRTQWFERPSLVLLPACPAQECHSHVSKGTQTPNPHLTFQSLLPGGDQSFLGCAHSYQGKLCAIKVLPVRCKAKWLTVVPAQDTSKGPKAAFRNLLWEHLSTPTDFSNALYTESW